MVAAASAPIAQPTPPTPPTAPLLEIRSLYVNYGGIQALQGVNLVVYPGEVVTLIGANGAGKTTTLRTISRLISPRGGQIPYAGEDIIKLRPDQVVRRG